MSSQKESERKRLYYQQNTEMIKAKTAAWKEKNPEAVAVHALTYRERHRLQLRERAAKDYLRKQGKL